MIARSRLPARVLVSDGRQIAFARKSAGIDGVRERHGLISRQPFRKASRRPVHLQHQH